MPAIMPQSSRQLIKPAVVLLSVTFPSKITCHLVSDIHPPPPYRWRIEMADCRTHRLRCPRSGLFLSVQRLSWLFVKPSPPPTFADSLDLPRFNSLVIFASCYLTLGLTSLLATLMRTFVKTSQRCRSITVGRTPPFCYGMYHLDYRLAK